MNNGLWTPDKGGNPLINAINPIIPATPNVGRFPFNLPKVKDFNWIADAHNPANTSDRYGALQILAGTEVGVQQLWPTPWSVICAFRFDWQPGSLARSGVMLRVVGGGSNDTGMAFFATPQTNGNFRIDAYWGTNAHNMGFSSFIHETVADSLWKHRPIQWFKVTYDGTNYRLYFSIMGDMWTLFSTTDSASHGGASLFNQAGVVTHAIGNQVMTVLHFETVNAVI